MIAVRSSAVISRLCVMSFVFVDLVASLSNNIQLTVGQFVVSVMRAGTSRSEATRWFELLTGKALVRLLGEMFQACITWGRPLGTPRLGNTSVPPRRPGGGESRKRSGYPSLDCCPCDLD